MLQESAQEKVEANEFMNDENESSFNSQYIEVNVKTALEIDKIKELILKVGSTLGDLRALKDQATKISLKIESVEGQLQNSIQLLDSKLQSINNLNENPEEFNQDFEKKHLVDSFQETKCLIEDKLYFFEPLIKQLKLIHNVNVDNVGLLMFKQETPTINPPDILQPPLPLPPPCPAPQPVKLLQLKSEKDQQWMQGKRRTSKNGREKVVSKTKLMKIAKVEIKNQQILKEEIDLSTLPQVKIVPLNPQKYALEQLVAQLANNIYVFRTKKNETAIVRVQEQKVATLGVLTFAYETACLHQENIILDRHVFTLTDSIKKVKQWLNVSDVQSLCGDHPDFVLIGGTSYTVNIARYENGEYKIMRTQRLEHSRQVLNQGVKFMQLLDKQQMAFYLAFNSSFRVVVMDKCYKLQKMALSKNTVSGKIQAIEKTDEENLTIISQGMVSTVKYNDLEIIASYRQKKVSNSLIKLPGFNINSSPFILMEDQKGWFVFDLKGLKYSSRIAVPENVKPVSLVEKDELILAIDGKNNNQLCLMKL